MASTAKLFREQPIRWLYAVVAALILSALAGTVIWLGPFPPRIIVMSTGTPGSDYDLLGRRYQTILRRSGVDLLLVPSAGGVENLRRLNDPHSDIGISFVQGGLADEAHSPGLESLGTMFYEPFWFFSRAPVGQHFEGLRGKRVAIGREGGGSRALSLQFLALNGIDQTFADLLPLSAAEASKALLRGDIDAATMVTSFDGEGVRELVASSEVNVVEIARADAYVALYPYLSKLTLPAGVGNMATNRPPVDVSLIAPKTSLIIRRELHPALQYLLLKAATEIHSAPDLFQRSGQFPAAERGDLPLSDEARQFYKTGPPFLQRYLPFWLAVLVSRLLLLLIPVIAIAYPLLSFVPTLYGWSVMHRIFRMYAELKFIETELERSAGTASTDLKARLERLERNASQLRVPVSFAHHVYHLRVHIDLVRNRIPRVSNPGTVDETAATDRLKVVDRPA
jgi:TRAP transporter TAXI family solute receptor